MTTTRPRDPRHEVVVEMETYTDDHYLTREQWEADDHRCITIASALDHHTSQGLTRTQVLEAHRWAAGVLARSALLIMSEMYEDWAERIRHPATCPHCGYWGDLWVTNPHEAAEKDSKRPPLVEFGVPKEHAEECADRFRRAIAEMLAEDLVRHGAAEPDHGPVVFTEPAPDTREADA